MNDKEISAIKESFKIGRVFWIPDGETCREVKEIVKKTDSDCSGYCVYFEDRLYLFLALAEYSDFAILKRFGVDIN